MKRQLAEVDDASRDGKYNGPVAHYGGETSLTLLAARQVFPQCSFVPCETISAVFSLVKLGEVQVGVIPIESTSVGSFISTYDELLYASSDVRILAEKKMIEKLALCSNVGVETELDIDCIVAHPHIFDSCQMYLQMLDRKRQSAGKANVEKVPALDSSQACAYVVKNSRAEWNIAAITNKESATRFDLHILVEHIGNDLNGETRYLVIGKASCSESLLNSLFSFQSKSSRLSLKKSIVFGCPNQPGSIFKWSSCFALRNVNISKLECRPSAIALKSREKQQMFTLRHFDFIYFVDYELSHDESVNSSLFSNLKEYTLFLYDLGTYSADSEAKLVAAPNPDCWKEVADILLA